MVKGFKVFNPDFTCRGFQYAVGGTYTHEGRLEPCSEGFHFCEVVQNCFNYYSFDPSNKVAEIEALGEVKADEDKFVTNKIRIVRELSWAEVLEIANLGKGNTGYGNAGHYNAGHYNAGNRNAGNDNAGNDNAGDFNSCNYSSGSFCSVEPEFLLFNKPSPISREDFNDSHAVYLCRQLRVVDPEGNKIDYKQAWANLWESFSNSNKITVQAMPNFDADVFEAITGIRV
ncbi:MAG: pentapeptide repeat-containing protein [Candidatus Pristimantibacillus sp.]